jgi:hypothetical protein
MILKISQEKNKYDPQFHFHYKVSKFYLEQFAFSPSYLVLEAYYVTPDTKTPEP